MEWKLGKVWKCLLWKCLDHETVLITSAVTVLIVLEKQEAGEKKGCWYGSAKGLTHHCHRSRAGPPQRIWHLSTRQRGHPRTWLTFYLHWQKRQKQRRAHHSGVSAVWAPSLLLWLSPLETCQTLEENFHGMFKAFNYWVYE